MKASFKKYILALFALVLALPLGLGLSAGALSAHAADATLHASGGNLAVTDNGYGKYHVRGTGTGYVYFDGIEVPENGRIYISLDMREYPLFDEVDSWLSFMVGSDQGSGSYGPNTPVSGERGPYYSQLMRFNRNGTISGNYFNNGTVLGDFTTISTMNVEICLVYQGSYVKVFVNGQEDKSFTTQKPQICYLSFAQFSSRPSDVFDYDVAVGSKAIAADCEYDLSENVSYAQTALKLMGTELASVKLLQNGSAVSEELYSVTESVGNTYQLKLDDSLLAEEEDGTSEFLLESSGGTTAFTVTTTDNAVVKIKSSSYDKYAGGSLSIPFSSERLTDIKLCNASMEELRFIDANKVIFPETYVSALDYGTHTYYMGGAKVSGKQSRLTAFTLRVYDTRNPAFGAPEFFIDSETDNEDFRIPFNLYDGVISAVRLNGNEVFVGTYRIEDGVFILSYNAVHMLSYGENSLIVKTDKSDAEIIVKLTDGRAPSVEQTVVIDKASNADYCIVPAELRGRKVLSLTLDGSAVTSWKQVQSGIRLETAVLPLAPEGLVLSMSYDEGTLECLLKIIDSAPPKILVVHHYDRSFGNGAEIVFINETCDFLKVQFGGIEFMPASFSDDVLTIPAGWFLQKIAEGSYRVGDMLEFIVVWHNRHTDEDVSSIVKIEIYDSESHYASLAPFDKANSSFSLPLLLNGYVVRYVKVNGEYTVQYALYGEEIFFEPDLIMKQSAGELKIEIFTELSIIKINYTLEDSRSAELIGEVHFEKDGSYPQGFKAEIAFYKNTVEYVIDSTGKNIPSYYYEVVADGIVFDPEYLNGLKIGLFNFFIGTRRVNYGKTVSEEIALCFQIDGTFEMTVSCAGVYELATSEDLRVVIEIGGNRFVGIATAGNMLPDTAYMRLERGLILLRSAYLHTLSSGSYSFTLVTDSGEKEFGLTITDSRVNALNAEKLSVNKGERELVLRATLYNSDFELYLNDKRLTADDYSVEGSYIVLSSKLVGKLSAGKHSLKIVSGAGEDTLVLEIMGGAPSYPLVIGLSVSITVIITAAIAVGVALILFKRRAK